MSKWINVEDRLPSEHMFHALGIVIEGGLTLGDNDSMIDIVAYNTKTKQWQQYIGEDDDANVKVSHWMSLPDRPKD